MNRVLAVWELEDEGMVGGVGIWGVHFFEFRGPILAFWVLPILGVFGPRGPDAHFGGFLPFLGVLVILSVFGVFGRCGCM